MGDRLPAGPEEPRAPRPGPRAEPRAPIRFEAGVAPFGRLKEDLTDALRRVATRGKPGTDNLLPRLLR